MSEKITLQEVLELVTFTKINGKWFVDDVAGEVLGDVVGSVGGDVLGAVCGSVGDDVAGSVFGSVLGQVHGEVAGKAHGMNRRLFSLLDSGREN